MRLATVPAEMDVNFDTVSTKEVVSMFPSSLFCFFGPAIDLGPC
jgi:hypothetical protein